MLTVTTCAGDSATAPTPAGAIQAARTMLRDALDARGNPFGYQPTCTIAVDGGGITWHGTYRELLAASYGAQA